MAENSAMERRYSMMKQQIGEQEGQQRAQEIEALRRRFAAMGALGSGAAIKTEQKVQQAGAQRLQGATSQLDIAKLGEQQQIEETEKQRGFMTGERVASQQYGSAEAEKQRGFMTGERQASETFASGEAGKQRTFMTGERESGQKFMTGERLSSQEFVGIQQAADLANRLEVMMNQIRATQGEGQATRRLQEQMFNKEFNLNQEIAKFNMYGAPAKPSSLPSNMYDTGSFGMGQSNMMGQ